MSKFPKNKLNVFHIVRRFPGKGGISTYLEQLIPLLLKSSISVTVVAAENDENDYPEALNVVYFKDEYSAIRYIKENKPDIVHIHDWLIKPILNGFTENDRIPKKIIHNHAYTFVCPGQDLYWRHQKQICDKGFGLRCLPNAYLKRCQMSRQPFRVYNAYRIVKEYLSDSPKVDLFIANSTFTKQKLVECQIPESKISTLNYFTDIKHVSDCRPVPNRILYIGRIAESKGIDILIDIVGHLGKHLDWSLMIAGDGYHIQSIKALVNNYRLNDRVQFSGWLYGEEKIKALYDASIVVVPSRWHEAFGIVGIEAMASARPVIAFNVGGISDWLTHNHTGYLIQPYNIKEFVSRTEQLLTNQDQAEEFGNNGLSVFKDKFTAESHVDELLNIYNDLLISA